MGLDGVELVMAVAVSVAEIVQQFVGTMKLPVKLADWPGASRAAVNTGST